jgi:hypothetical protein
MIPGSSQARTRRKATGQLPRPSETLLTSQLFFPRRCQRHQRWLLLLSGRLQHGLRKVPR